MALLSTTAWTIIASTASCLIESSAATMADASALARTICRQTASARARLGAITFGCRLPRFHDVDRHRIRQIAGATAEWRHFFADEADHVLSEEGAQLLGAGRIDRPASFHESGDVALATLR